MIALGCIFSKTKKQSLGFASDYEKTDEIDRNNLLMPNTAIIAADLCFEQSQMDWKLNIDPRSKFSTTVIKLLCFFSFSLRYSQLCLQFLRYFGNNWYHLLFYTKLQPCYCLLKDRYYQLLSLRDWLIFLKERRSFKKVKRIRKLLFMLVIDIDKDQTYQFSFLQKKTAGFSKQYCNWEIRQYQFDYYMKSIDPAECQWLYV